MKQTNKINILSELEKIVSSIKVSFNEMIHDNILLFEYKNISDIHNINKIFNQIKILYKISQNKLINTITCVKQLKKMLLNKKLFNQNTTHIFSDLFLEVEASLSFFLLNFKPNKELLMEFNYDYYHFKMLLLYLYSFFDNIACLLFHHYNSNDINIDYEKSIRNVFFDKPKSYLKKESSSNNFHLFNEIDKIAKSDSFGYIRNIRNNLYHRFNNPMLRYHFSTDIMICFIILVELILIIKDNMGDAKLTNYAT